jgi:hypothetical protein
MKTLQRGVIGVVARLLTSAVQTSGIEGLKLSIHCPDVWLSWPSVEGQYYIVQWREDLSTNSTWVTLTNLLPAETGTNITTFVHSNRVDCPTGQIFGMMFSGAGSSGSGSESEKEDFQPPYPTVIPKDGSKAPMPLGIYPPGLDLSGYIIIWLDGSIDEWSKELVEKWRAIRNEESGDPQPEDAGGDGPGTGFYQVVRDGVHVVSVTNLTNGVLSGIMGILIEAGNADWAGADLKGVLNCAMLIVDGEKFAGDGVLGPPPAYPWQFNMDTAYLENGDHTVQVQVLWTNPDSTDNNNQFLERYSDVIPISVSNTVFYPQWEPQVGEAGISAYYLRTVFTNQPWQIDITDQNGTYLQTLTGYATNGVIEAFWNLTDTNNVAHTNADVDSEFLATVAAAAAPPKKTPTKKQARNDFPDHGKWVISYQDFFKFEYSQNDEMQGSVDFFAGTGDQYGGSVLYYPPPGATNDIGQTYPLRYQKTNHVDTNITGIAMLKDENLLIKFLTNSTSRNFFYMGHGGGTTIGNGIPAAKLRNAPLKHRYRFVFLFGCVTATGEWDRTFGINGPGHYDLTHYQKSGLRPAIFCGYKAKTYYAKGPPITVNGVTYDDQIPWQVPGFITNYLFAWDLLGYGAFDSFVWSYLNLPDVQGWSVQPWDGLVIYGFEDLRVDEFNHKTDWP